jgi:hypothetical protein
MTRSRSTARTHSDGNADGGAYAIGRQPGRRHREDEALADTIPIRD